MRHKGVVVAERDGTFVRAWGEGMFTPRAHGLTVAPDDTLWFTDDGDHSVRKFTRDGELLRTLGTSGRPSDTGYDGKNHGSVQRAAGPFNRPTNLAIAPKGDLYVSDGYGNARVHHFSPRGELVRSWGEPGSGPGQFRLVHAVAVDEDGRVFVCDRENDRIQIFSPEGEYLEEWTSVQRPTHLVFDGRGHAIVGELTWRAGMTSFRRGPITKNLPSRVAILDLTGAVIARLGDGESIDESDGDGGGARQVGHGAHASPAGDVGAWGGADPCLPGNFCAPHGLALDPTTGDLYVAEVTYTIGVSKNLVPANCHTIQKFTAVS